MHNRLQLSRNYPAAQKTIGPTASWRWRGASGWLRAGCAQLAIILTLAGCAGATVIKPGPAAGKTVCDSYIILYMCAQDLSGDGKADLIYFSDTNEIFMWREGMKERVAEVMPFHRCAVPLGADMQAVANRILISDELSLSEQLGIKKTLLFTYLDAKPGIDACNARFDHDPDGEPLTKEEFFMDDAEWEDE